MTELFPGPFFDWGVNHSHDVIVLAARSFVIVEVTAFGKGLYSSILGYERFDLVQVSTKALVNCLLWDNDFYSGSVFNAKFVCGFCQNVRINNKESHFIFVLLCEVFNLRNNDFSLLAVLVAKNGKDGLWTDYWKQFVKLLIWLWRLHFKIFEF